MASRRRRAGRATGAAAAVGLCLAAVTTTHTSLAFHLQTAPRGAAVAVGRCDHAAVRRSATCRLAMLRRSRGDGQQQQPSSEEGDSENSSSSGDDGPVGRRESGAAAKELSALLLSAMLLGNPQLSDAAAAATTAVGGGGAGSPAVDPTAQGRLIADLEKKLMSIPSSNSNSNSGAGEAGRRAADADDADVVDAPRIQPKFVPPTAAATAVASDAAEAPAPEATAPAGWSPSATTGAPGSSRSRSSNSNNIGTKNKEPLIRMKDYSFSVKLPELNLPPVAPITVPEEGNPFAGAAATVLKAPSRERVEARPDLPGAGAVRGALQSVGGVKDLADALANARPKQGDYNR